MKGRVVMTSALLTGKGFSPIAAGIYSDTFHIILGRKDCFFHYGKIMQDIMIDGKTIGRFLYGGL
jgi:hypothetical protein